MICSLINSLINSHTGFNCLTFLHCSLFTSIADNKLMTVFYIAVFSHLVVPLIEYIKVQKTYFLREKNGSRYLIDKDVSSLSFSTGVPPDVPWEHPASDQGSPGALFWRRSDIGTLEGWTTLAWGDYDDPILLLKNRKYYWLLWILRFRFRHTFISR